MPLAAISGNQFFFDGVVARALICLTLLFLSFTRIPLAGMRVVGVLMLMLVGMGMGQASPAGVSAQIAHARYQAALQHR